MFSGETEGIFLDSRSLESGLFWQQILFDLKEDSPKGQRKSSMSCHDLLGSGYDRSEFGAFLLFPQGTWNRIVFVFFCVLGKNAIVFLVVVVSNFLYCFVRLRGRFVAGLGSYWGDFNLVSCTVPTRPANAKDHHAEASESHVGLSC